MLHTAFESACSRILILFSICSTEDKIQLLEAKLKAMQEGLV